MAKPSENIEKMAYNTVYVQEKNIFYLTGETFSRDRESFLPRLEFSTTQMVNLTRRLAQVVASLSAACYLAVVKPIARFVRIACSGLMITRLLEFVNRLDAS